MLFLFAKVCARMCVFVFDPPLRQDVQAADRLKFASAAASEICLICPLITRQVAFLQRTWATISFLRKRDLHISKERASRHSEAERRNGDSEKKENK